MVMSFPPGKAQLIGDVIKVHGTMHAHAAVDKDGYNVLDVDVDYLFVYAIEPPHTPASWMRIVNEVDWTLSFGNWAGAATTFEPSISTNRHRRRRGRAVRDDRRLPAPRLPGQPRKPRRSRLTRPAARRWIRT